MVSGQKIWCWHAGALALYGLESWLFLDHGASLTRNVLGSTADPMLIMWFLSWWPWALIHHVHSLHSMLMWQPIGLNLAWTTCVPLLAWLAAPVTLLAGPILAFNLLTLAGPALAAWAAYFLCLELFAAPQAALIGGWLFGFSTYETVQSFDHLNLQFTALLPLVLLVAVRRVQGNIGRRAFVACLTLLLAGEFCISMELLATAAMFGGIGFALAYAMLAAWRPRLRVLAVDVTLTAPFALILVSPFLWAMLTGSYDVAHPAKWPHIFSTDLLNFIVPTLGTAFGGAWAYPLSQRFAGGLDEQAAFLGPVVILLLLAAWRRFRSLGWFRLAFVMLGVTLIASLGPELWIGGVRTSIKLPWTLILHLPLLGAALPARCMVYAWLLVAIILAGWIAERARRLGILLGLLACVSLLPSQHPAPKAPISTFFQPGRVEAVLGPSPRLLILPFGLAGPSSYWQAQNRFGFTQSGGYLGFPPVGMQKYPVVMQLYSDVLLPHFTEGFVQFCQATGVQYVVAGPGTVPGEQAVLAALDWKAQKIDDVTVYTVPPQ